MAHNLFPGRRPPGALVSDHTMTLEKIRRDAGLLSWNDYDFMIVLLSKLGISFRRPALRLCLGPADT